MKKSLIIQEAKEIKNYMEKNKAIPKSCNMNGTILSPYSVSYLMALLIQDNFKKDTYSYNPVVMYNSNKKYDDTIQSENVFKDDYMRMIGNFIRYCVDHQRVPAYITTQKSKTKVSFELFMYCLSKIVVYYHNNQTLPNYCNFNKEFTSNANTPKKTIKNEVKQSTSTSKNCTNPYTSSPHLTDSNMGQDKKYSCANNSQQQELFKLTGKIFKETDLAKWSGTTTNGTSHQGINTCIAYVAKKLGIKLTVKWVNFSDLGKTIEERFEALGKIICQPNKGVITHIAYMSGGENEFRSDGIWYGHYEPIRQINTKNKTVQVLNSLGTKRADGGYKGHLQTRTYKVEASYLRNTPGGQPSICIITKG